MGGDTSARYAQYTTGGVDGTRPETGGGVFHLAGLASSRDAIILEMQSTITVSDYVPLEEAMQLRRIRVALRPVLVAILAVTLLTVGVSASAAPEPPTAPARLGYWQRRSSICYTTQRFCTINPTINPRFTCRILAPSPPMSS